MASKGKTTRARALPAVLIRMPDEAAISLLPDADFAADAMKWSYVARNRDRWNWGMDPGQGDSGPLQKRLTDAQLRRIAEAEWVEVSMPASPNEADDWPLRVFPWEYALSAATRGLRSHSLTVVRHVQGAAHPARGAADLSKPAVLELSPGRLAAFYDTRAEGDLMLSSMGRDPHQGGARLCNPTEQLAAEWLAREQPSTIHLAGVDAHQAVSLLGLEAQFPPREVKDGLAFKHPLETGGIALVEAERVAAMICAGKPPSLVVCNAYNSASRIAARCVALGAGHAIGFHDVIEDGLAAIFCASLYRGLAQTAGDMRAAFSQAVQAVRAQPGQLRGACIVLWSRSSLLDAKPRAGAGAKAQAAVPVAQAGDVAPRQRIRVERNLREQVNYSLLHNNQSLFRSLQVFRNNVQGAIHDIQVTVDLNAGEPGFPYRLSFDLPEGQNGRDLTHEVVLPLTSSLIRTQNERIQSSLRLHVSCGGQTVQEETFRVGLSPVDEWQDGEKDEWRWLPSFILPRDPAVARIIDSAQGILCALADDPTVGFDGYQCVDASSAKLDQACAGVDAQVQAIWYAVLNAHGLGYINPPPSYGQQTQRLRTPSQLLSERRGTCIDLALLLAACLEYVDIYPVVFLLTGHAFVGYWRSDALHSAFLEMQGLEQVFGQTGAASAASTMGAGGASSANSPGYILGQDQHREVRSRVAAGEIIALEATWLTSRGGFEAAIAEGRNNLRRASEFAAMIDVKLARDRAVTPLPLMPLGQGRQP